jgi:Ser/Thr protein kinase RdoA (MazF antagonist)
MTPDRHSGKAASGNAALDAACVDVGTPAQNRAVPRLRRLWPEDRRARAIARLFPDGALAQARMVPLSYRLGRRLQARLDGNGGAALLKTHAPDRFGRAQVGALAARVLGHGRLERACSRTGAIATRWHVGETLSASSNAAGFAEAGAALAALHRCGLDLPFTETRTDETRAASTALADAARLLPDLAPLLADLSRRLAGLPQTTPADTSPVHEDFGPDHAVIRSGRASIIDWDRDGTGDRAADLGAVLARLDAARITEALRPEAAQAADALITGYEAQRALPQSLELQRAALLACLMTYPFRRQLADWPRTIAALADEMRRRLDSLSPVAIADSALPQLGTLLTPGGAQALLDAAERRPEAADRIARLRHRAAVLPRAEATAMPVLLQRDFYPDQALVDGAQVWLIDLDLAAMRDAHVALGKILAHPTEWSLRHDGSATALAGQGQPFLEGYAAGGGR